MSYSNVLYVCIASVQVHCGGVLLYIMAIIVQSHVMKWMEDIFVAAYFKKIISLNYSKSTTEIYDSYVRVKCVFV